MLRVSASQAKTPVKNNPEFPACVLGDIDAAKELVPYYEQGAGRVAAADATHGPSVVHGDYKLDNMVCYWGETWLTPDFPSHRAAGHRYP